MGGLTVAGFVPLCMDADELAGWRDANARAGGGRARIPCADCSFGFAAEMRAEGRCNGHPGGFEEDEDMDTTPTLADTTKARIAVTAPCEACGHAPVCRLRPEVEAVAAATVAVPKLGSGLRLELAGTVACDWFTRAPKPRRELSPEERQAAAARMAHARAVAAERKRQEAEAA